MSISSLLDSPLHPKILAAHDIPSFRDPQVECIRRVLRQYRPTSQPQQRVPGFLIGLKTGNGKSITSETAAFSIVREGAVGETLPHSLPHSILIVAPVASLDPVWSVEMTAWQSVFPDMRYEVYHVPSGNRNSPDRLARLRRAQVVITNYDTILGEYKDLLKHQARPGQESTFPHPEFHLFNTPWKVMILDEIQILKNFNGLSLDQEEEQAIQKNRVRKPKPNKGNAVCALRDSQVDFVIGLSGTIFGNDRKEARAFARLVVPTRVGQYQPYWMAKGYWTKASDAEFRRAFHSFYYTCPSVDFGPKHSYTVRVVMTEQQMKMLHSLLQDVQAIMEGEEGGGDSELKEGWALEVFKVFNKMRQVCQGNYVLKPKTGGGLLVNNKKQKKEEREEMSDSSEGETKEEEEEENDGWGYGLDEACEEKDEESTSSKAKRVPWVPIPASEFSIQSAASAPAMHLLRDILRKGEKAVVFCEWERSAQGLDQLIRETFPDQQPLFYNSYMPLEERNDTLRIFQTGNKPEHSVILCGIRCSSVAINLTAANHALIMTPWWNPAVEEQALSRIYRMRQTRPVHIYRFIAEGLSIDTFARIIQHSKWKNVVPLGLKEGEASSEDYHLMNMMKHMTFREKIELFLENSETEIYSKYRASCRVPEGVSFHIVCTDLLEKEPSPLQESVLQKQTSMLSSDLSLSSSSPSSSSSASSKRKRADEEQKQVSLKKLRDAKEMPVYVAPQGVEPPSAAPRSSLFLNVQVQPVAALLPQAARVAEPFVSAQVMRQAQAQFSPFIGTVPPAAQTSHKRTTVDLTADTSSSSSSPASPKRVKTASASAPLPQSLLNMEQLNKHRSAVQLALDDLKRYVKLESEVLKDKAKCARFVDLFRFLYIRIEERNQRYGGQELPPMERSSLKNQDIFFVRMFRACLQNYK